MGHRDHVTQIDPVQSGSRQLLLSSGKDGFLKVWDLREQYCVLSQHVDE